MKRHYHRLTIFSLIFLLLLLNQCIAFKLEVFEIVHFNYPRCLQGRPVPQSAGHLKKCHQLFSFNCLPETKLLLNLLLFRAPQFHLNQTRRYYASLRLYASANQLFNVSKFTRYLHLGAGLEMRNVFADCSR